MNCLDTYSAYEKVKLMKCGLFKMKCRLFGFCSNTDQLSILSFAPVLITLFLFGIYEFFISQKLSAKLFAGLMPLPTYCLRTWVG